MTNRDDFSEQVKQVLRDRVGGFCSNPQCRASTTGPHTDSGKRLSIGKAAHITAAAPGGPRYNPNLSPDQRSSAENGIWLCSNCADLIDKDPASYPIEVLINWKMQAETEQNNRLLNPNYKGGTTVNNPVVINAGAGSNVNVTLNLWRELGENLERYQGAVDFAYENWTHNFKHKYPGIHEEKEGFFNSDVQGLQDEIDQYADTLYKTMLDAIYEGFKETQNKLAESMNVLKVDMSQQLEISLKDYLNCMTFHYDSDEGVGFVNYYWSSFFVTLDKNYDRMRVLKDQIDGLIRTEYKMAKGEYF